MNKLSTPAGPVSVTIDGPARSPLVVLAHGAGNDMNSDFMAFMASALAQRRLKVARFNFVYMEMGKRAPDRQAVLEETYRAVAEQLTGKHGELFLGGKSLGGRIASHIVSAGFACRGLIFLGYPLHPPGKPERLRAAHLESIAVPMLFVEGTRDPFCPLDTLDKVIAKLDAPCRVARIEDGDHSLKVRKSSGRSTEDAWNEATDAVASWVRETGSRR